MQKIKTIISVSNVLLEWAYMIYLGVRFAADIFINNGAISYKSILSPILLTVLQAIFIL